MEEAELQIELARHRHSILNVAILNGVTTPFLQPKTMRMLLPELLPSLVEAKFSAAKASSSLLFSPTEVTTIRTRDGVPVSGTS